MFMSELNANAFMKALENAKEILRSTTEVIIVSTNTARNIIRSSDIQYFPPTILFSVSDHCEDNKAYLFKNELKENILDLKDRGLVTLYTFEELKVLVKED